MVDWQENVARPCPHGCAERERRRRLMRLVGGDDPGNATFDVTFHPVVRPAARAVEAAVRERRPLFALLVGPYGVGKSHILRAAVGLARELGLAAVYVLWPHLERRLRRAVEEESLDRVVDALLAVDLLALDELDKGHGTEFTLALLTDVLDGRYRRRCITVMAANSLQGVPPYVLSRARDGRVGGFWDLSGAPDVRPLLKP